MSNYKLRNTGPVLVCIAALGLRTVCGQTSPGLQGWFQALMQGPALVAKPSQDELSALQKRVSAADPDEVHGAIPWMIGALRLNDGGKEHYAFFGLLAAALRSDGPTLLKDRMGDVVSLLTSPGTLAQRGAVFVLGSIQQRQLAPVPGLSQALVSFVKRTDRDLQAQVSAVAFLLSRSGNGDARRGRGLLVPGPRRRFPHSSPLGDRARQREPEAGATYRPGNRGAGQSRRICEKHRHRHAQPHWTPGGDARGTVATKAG